MNDLPTSDWTVFRLDYAGNTFEVERNLTQTQAEALAAEFESHGHHQHYWAQRVPHQPPCRESELRQLLSCGSPLQLALRVLAKLGTSTEELIDAVCEVKSLEREDATKLIEQTLDQMGA